MSSDQHSHARPRWKRIFNFAVCALIMSGAAWVNVKTQIHLAERLPDWAGYAWIIPVACWLYAIQTTVNWASSAPGSAERDEHLRSVKIAVGLTEAMNLGEHIWAYTLEHEGKFGWDIVPLLALGSLPALMDFLSIHTTARVLSERSTPTEPKFPAEVSKIPDEVSKAAEVSTPPPDPKVPVDEPAPNLPPAPNFPPDSEAKVPATKPKSKSKPVDVVGARRRSLDEDRQRIRDLLKQGVPPETMTGKWLNEQNPDRRDPRSWLMLKKWVLENPETEHAADNLSASA